MRLTGLLTVARTFLRAEVANVKRFDVPWRRRLWLYSRGFLSSRDAVWELSGETADQYLSDREYHELGRIAGQYESGLGNKLLFRLVVGRSHGDLLPDLYGIVRDGAFVDADHAGRVGSCADLRELVAERPVVVKPTSGARGAGVAVLDSEDGRLRLDGRPVGREAVCERCTGGGDVLLEERVDQAGYAAGIYPSATNTLRLLTMIDPETGAPFVAAATHRFGTADSGATDNWSAGGISAAVDADTGRLGRAVTNPEFGRYTGERLATHPDTGARIEGVTVPAWTRVVEQVRGLADAYGWLWPHVGWDVVVRDGRGEIAVLEGDPKSVDADLQAHEPLLADPRVRRFYEHHGVLRDGGTLP